MCFSIYSFYNITNILWIAECIRESIVPYNHLSFAGITVKSLIINPHQRNYEIQNRIFCIQYMYYACWMFSTGHIMLNYLPHDWSICEEIFLEEFEDCLRIFWPGTPKHSGVIGWHITYYFTCLVLDTILLLTVFTVLISQQVKNPTSGC